MNDKTLSFTRRSLAEALDNVRCLSDLGPELIAAQVFAASAQQPALTVPEGWKLVPVDPTEEILDAICLAKNMTRRGLAVVMNMQELESIYRAMIAAAPAAPVARPTDAMLDDMRKRGLSIDGDNAYKRDLLDAVVGAMAFGKQRSAKPPAGHWLEEFYEIGEAEADERDQLRAEVEEMRKDAERLDFMIDERAVIQELLALDGPRFTLAWTESGEFQKHVYGTPREAIEAAMAAKEG